MAKGFKKMTRVEEFKANKLLEENYLKGDDGLWEYQEGWSDARIREMVGIISLNAVATLRQNVFGPMRTAKTIRVVGARNSSDAIKAAVAEALTSMSERLVSVERLVGRITALEEWATARPVVPFGKK